MIVGKLSSKLSLYSISHIPLTLDFVIKTLYLPDPKIYNEKELLLLVAAGDELAFQLIFDHYHSYINFVALRLTGNVAMAENIIQDTFVKVWINRKTLVEKK